MPNFKLIGPIQAGPTRSKPKKKKRSRRAKKAKSSAQLTVLRDLGPAQFTRRFKLQNTSSSKDMLLRMCNPFHPAAKGCRCPDGYGMPTLAFQLRSFSIMSIPGSGAGLTAGNTVQAFSPCWPYNTSQVASFAGGSYTWGLTWGTLSPNATLTKIIVTDDGTYRLNCGGMIIRSVQSAAGTTPAQGTIIISKMNARPTANSNYVSGNTYGSDVMVVPLTAGLEVVVLFRPVGMGVTMFQAQSNSTGPTTTSPDFPWDCVIVEVLGASAALGAPVLSIEYVCNYELVVNSPDISLSEFATEGPSLNHFVMDNMSAVYRKMGGIFQGGVTAFAKTASNAVANVVAARLGGSAGLGLKGALLDSIREVD